jgi:hypothetical protein
MLFWLTVGVVCLCGIAAAEVTAPTPQFLAAALKKQETLCGPSLQVVYEYTNEVKNTLLRKGTYIRTPGRLFSDETGTEGSRTTTSYDRGTHEWRKLWVIQKPDDETTKMISANVKNGIDQPFNTASLLETSLYYVSGGPLCERVVLGTVAGDQESIEGHPCWRVTIPDGPQNCIVWLDPAIGFCARQIQINHPEGMKAWKESFGDYREIKQGVWFPFQHVAELYNNKDEKLCYSNHVISATAGRAVSSDQLKVTFPSGIDVYGPSGGAVLYVEP